MRSFLKPAAGLVRLVTPACAGCSSEYAATNSTTAYAPYVSATTASDLDPAGRPSAYSLAFVIVDGDDCTPAWGGTAAVDDAAVASRVSALKESGATVRVAFGGASGTEPAEARDSASALASAYGQALDAAGASAADSDVEGDALTDAASVDLRSEAIAQLQEEREGLSVSFTLPVMPSGLDDDGVALLESANDHSVQVSTVDVMTMDYGSSYDGDMGDYAETSAEAAHDRLADVFGLSDETAWHGLALTSMIDENDVENETFTLHDAARVREFADERGFAWVSVWGSFRNRRCDTTGTTRHHRHHQHHPHRLRDRRRVHRLQRGGPGGRGVRGGVLRLTAEC
ncbi:hydrolase [Streptomyces ruber]|uniref:Hydrolase n=2 Tax=Streptomyces TaxID=1883 RepID=A0A918BGP0_9ACTN|nr:hydrolase [Streptomyces ruber]